MNGTVFRASLGVLAVWPALCGAQMYTNEAAFGYSGEALGRQSVETLNTTPGCSVSSPQGEVWAGEFSVSNTSAGGSGVVCGVIIYASGYHFLDAGKILRADMDVKVSTSSTSHPSGNAVDATVLSGFRILTADERKYQDWIRFPGRADVFQPGDQHLVMEFPGGVTPMTWAAGDVATIARPYLTIQNVKPGERVVLTMKSAPIMRRGQLNGIGVSALSSVFQGASGQNWPVSVELLVGKPLNATTFSRIQLIDRRVNRVVYTSPTKLAPPHWGGATGTVTDAFQLKVPNLSSGAYTVRYQMLGANAVPVPLTLLSKVALPLGMAPNGQGADIGTLEIDSTGKAGMFVGMSFHRYNVAVGDIPVGPSEAKLGPIALPYAFARTGASDLLVEGWWSMPAPGAPVDQINFKAANFQAWADKFSPPTSSPKAKTLLVNFNRSPQIGSDEGSKIRPPDLTNLREAVKQTVSRYGDRIFAIECWNEPDMAGFFNGTQTQLADICKTIKQTLLDPVNQLTAYSKIPVICPQATSPAPLGYVLSAKTSEGQPITDYCDWIGAHLYQGLGHARNGRPFGSDHELSDLVRLMKKRIADWGLTLNRPLSSKPLVVTEFGLPRTPAASWLGVASINDLTETTGFKTKGEVAAQSLMALRQEGVRSVGIYSYDLNPGDVDLGYFMLTNLEATQMNSEVVNKVDGAIRGVMPKSAAW